MAKKDQLRELRANTRINLTSSKQEKEVITIVLSVADKISREFDVSILFERSLLLGKDIVAKLRKTFEDVEFNYERETSSIKPDGGVLMITDRNAKPYPILVTEVKNQGTNDRRAEEGLKKQSQGNAIERLGKNVIGLRTYMLDEEIFPFVCFGYGCDFAEGSSIRDRVITIAQFGKLNKIYLFREATCNEIRRGSYFFREQGWTADEMFDVCYEIARRSVMHYKSKYGEVFQSLEACSINNAN